MTKLEVSFLKWTGGVLTTIVLGWCAWVSRTIIDNGNQIASISTNMSSLNRNVEKLNNLLYIVAPKLGINPEVAASNLQNISSTTNE